MAVIRKCNSKNLHYQIVRKTTTKNDCPNDRFGLNNMEKNIFNLQRVFLMVFAMCIFSNRMMAEPISSECK